MNMTSDYLKNRKILLVDDEPQLLKMTEGILREAGFHFICTAGSIKNALEILASEMPEIAVLDVMLPDGSGYDLLKEIRKTSDIPVLFLTACDRPEDLYTGLDAGGDDYMVKPFLPRELLLRITAILRRCYKNEKSQLQLAHALIDFEKAEVFRSDGAVFPLTAKEHAILIHLSKAANRIVTIDALCVSAWGDNLYGYENSLMAHIRRIREKIEINPSAPDSLVTVRGLGYKLIV